MKNGSDLEKELSIILVKSDLMPLIVDQLRKAEPKKGLPGFRPGNAPLQTLYGQYGRNAVQEAVRHIISARATEWTENKEMLSPVSFTVDWDSVPDHIDKIDNIETTIHLSFMPDIEKIDWKTVTITSYDAEISPTDIQSEIENRASQRFQPTPLEKERPAEKGDFLFYNTHHKTKDGQESVAGHSLRLGNYLLPQEFEDSLIGIKKGHEIKEKIHVPKNYPDPKIAGKKAIITITFHDIQGSKACSPDEEFAKISGFQSLDDMKKSVQKELVDYASILSEILERRSLKKILSERLSFHIPPSFVKKIEDQIRHSLPKDHKADDAAVHKKAMDHARLECWTKKMTRTHDLQVKDEELMTYAKHMAQQSGQSVDAVIELWRSHPHHVDAIVQDILERKSIDMALSLCQKEKEKISFQKISDLIHHNDAQPLSTPKAQEDTSNTAHERTPAS